MVSKIAVMALVAVVAVPILLGYGMNIQTENKQVWVSDDNPRDVSEYLLNSFDSATATFTNADIYQMNSNSFYRYAVPIYDPLYPQRDIPTYPEYRNIISTNTALPLNVNRMTGTFTVEAGHYLQITVDGKYDSNNYYSVRLAHDGGELETVILPHIKFFQMDYSGTVRTILLDQQNHYVYGGPGSAVTSVQFVATGDIGASVINDDGTNSHYADITGGYRLNMDGPVWPSDVNSVPNYVEYTNLDISETTKNVLLSMDLNTITDADARFRISSNLGRLELRKTTVADVVKWEYMDKNAEWVELYYNPLTSSNTYQLYINSDYSGELRYIGSWRDMIGAVDGLLVYPVEIQSYSASEYMDHLAFYGQTPVMRVESALIGAYDFRVMNNAVYDPAIFKNNPATTITNVIKYGTSLVFGGITYTVDKGNIKIGNHDITLNGIVFDSVQMGGQYENRINGNTVSITSEPSTITFNGKWRAEINTDSQSLTNVSETKWQPGSFAWNGIDHNFIIAGLMTCLGAFVALSIYGRRSGAKILPLLLVCGGAAFMFLLML